MLTLLAAGLLALIPVWRLRVAGWPPRWLFASWLLLVVVGMLVLRFPGPSRFLIPLLVLAYVAPFVAGPERVTRVLGGRKPERGVIIDVTPLNRRDDPGSAGDGSGDDRPDGGA